MVGILAFGVASCGDSSDSEGKLSLSLTDAPAPEYQTVYVTISEIQVHRAGAEEGSWQTILTPNATYNLLDLVNGETAALGVASLPTGTYTQMRLILGDTPDGTENILDDPHPYANYLITSADEAMELKVPSGFQTGIKLVRTFEIESGRTVGLVLDFDANRSVVKAGNSGKWLLKPTIKVIDTLNLAILAGTVTDQSPTAIPGVSVSAQVYNADTDTVTTVASTVTDSEGEYFMYLAPGTYTIVAAADGYSTACALITTAFNMDYTEDFTLAPATMTPVTIALSLPTGSSGVTASIEFRQISPCNPAQKIAVKYINYSESGSYDVNLPSGTYSVAAIYAEQTIKVSDVTGGTITIDFTAP
jgi:hypothetical protein